MFRATNMEYMSFRHLVRTHSSKTISLIISITMSMTLLALIRGLITIIAITRVQIPMVVELGTQRIILLVMLELKTWLLPCNLGV